MVDERDPAVAGREGQARGHLWQARFADGPAETLRALSDSLVFDIRLFREDIAGSRAHVTMLASVGLLTPAERDKIVKALDRVEKEIDSGILEFIDSDEDIHTVVERRVIEIAGAAGAKLHAGRSRNDQIVADMRLWTRGAIDDIIGLIRGLQRTVLSKAEAAGEAYLPGYTHMQQAQPVTLAHHLLAHGWALQRDIERLADARSRVDVSPLGAGALAGSSLPLDPEMTADLLGFGAVFENSLDAVSDRDFVAETLFVLTLLGVHLSRIGEELVIWSTSEFGFVEFDDSFVTGSSMMPQKKNPDVAELVRGKSGRLIGNLAGLLATLKGLPLAYNKDLQEDKEPLFDTVDNARLSLLALDGLLASCRFLTKRMAEAAASPEAAATDLAEWLVEEGMPFREAHALVAEAVRRSIDENVPLLDLVESHPQLGPVAAALVAPGVSVSRRSTRGGAGPAAVRDQIERFRVAIS